MQTFIVAADNLGMEARWNSLYFNARPEADHTKNEMFFNQVENVIENVATGLLPESIVNAPVQQNYSEFSSQYVRATQYSNQTGAVLTMYIRSAQVFVTKTLSPQSQIVFVAGSLGGYYIAITMLGSIGLIVSLWIMGALKYTRKGGAKVAQIAVKGGGEMNSMIKSAMSHAGGLGQHPSKQPDEDPGRVASGLGQNSRNTFGCSGAINMTTEEE